MKQTLALFVDAYRELNARRMFWITLLLSGLVVCILFLIGLSPSDSDPNENRLRIAFWELPFPMPPDMTLEFLLKGAFVSIGLGLWLTWAAMILALISTASIFPDFVSSGSIDLVLSKPIGRLRLFLTKYAGGLLFVALQVTAFSAVAFLIIGGRTGVWEPALFLAVPLVVIFFSYLFGVCALVGLLTRSTVAALLLTVLLWLILFGFNFTDQMLAVPRVAHEIYVEKLQERLEQLQQRDDSVNQHAIEATKSDLADAIEDRNTLRWWHRLIVSAKTVLPKTSETIAILERWLIDLADLPETEEDETGQQNPFISPKMWAAGVRMNDVTMQVQVLYRDRSAVWVIGTSLGFEAVILAICALIFCRRDF